MRDQLMAAAHEARVAVQSLFHNDKAAQALGIEIKDVVPGRVRIEMTVRPDMVNGWGICHGGVVFALADTAFAYACCSYGEPMVAGGASIEFIAPTPVGERLVAIATEVLRAERHGIYDVAVQTSSSIVIAYFRGRCARWRGSPPFKSTEAT